MAFNPDFGGDADLEMEDFIEHRAAEIEADALAKITEKNQRIRELEADLGYKKAAFWLACCMIIVVGVL